MDDTEKHLDFATRLAIEAADIILAHKDASLTVETKSDMSPVTQVDRTINKLVAQRIAAVFPSHGLLGEEENAGTGDERYQWLCDPLDGTRAFILGVPVSTFMLALLDHGEPILSVVRDPFAGRTFFALKGRGSECNGMRIHVNNLPLSDGYVTLDTDALHLLTKLNDMGGTFHQVSSSGFKCLLLAQGKTVGYIKFDTTNHDMGPASLIIEEAGGKVTGLDGKPLRYDKTIGAVVASNGICHNDLLTLAQSQKGPL